MQKLFIDDQIGFVELIETFGSDLTVANAARVSFNKESQLEPVFAESTAGKEPVVVGHKLAERDAKLINYLAQHHHITPFFHPQIQFRLKMPIYVAREWFRHTVGFARNEVSRRYVFDMPECFIPAQLRKRDAKIKQGSSNEVIEMNEAIVAQIQHHAQESVRLYLELLDKGVCPEQARGVLPQSMYTEFIETASLAAYARLAKLRLDPTAQKEIRDYASLVSKVVASSFPVSWEALIR